MLLRVLGRPEPELLSAALETSDAQALMERAVSYPPDLLSQHALSACVQAHAIWQRLPVVQRTQIAGFSLPLLALAGDQALRLHQAHAEYERLLAERSDALTRLKELCARDLRLCAQARQVLEKVSDASHPIQEDLAIDPQTTSTFVLAQTLLRLAHAAGAILRSPEAPLRTRARLYGLNETFLSSLEKAGAELVDVDEKATDTRILRAKSEALTQLHKATFVLVSQLEEAFLAAHQLDPEIPELAPIPDPNQSAATLPRVDAPPSPHRDGRTLPAVPIPLGGLSGETRMIGGPQPVGPGGTRVAIAPGAPAKPGVAAPPPQHRSGPAERPQAPTAALPGVAPKVGTPTLTGAALAPDRTIRRVTPAILPHVGSAPPKATGSKKPPKTSE